MKGILGTKEGMTGVFNENGKLIPVTVIKIEPNVITQIKTKETDGYNSVQLSCVEVREKVSNKPQMGITKKASTTPKRFLKEIRDFELENANVGDELKADIFAVGEMVDVTGTSKGKGFQGVIKRHNQQRGPMAHGSRSHRRPGSMGTMLPKRVMKGKNLPGHMGYETVTIQNLEIIDVDLENNIVLVKGNVPGIKGSLVVIKSAVKNEGVINKNPKLVSYIEEIEVEEIPEVEEINEEIVEETEEQAEETNEEATSEEQTEEPIEENAEVNEEEKSAE